MQHETKILIAAILSISLGVTAASPLLMSKIDFSTIRQYPEPPKGPYADISIDVLYANFSINPSSMPDRFTGISYFTVVNITNNSNETAKIMAVACDAKTPNYNKPAESGWRSGRGWDAEYAWVDGKYYNITWVPNNEEFSKHGPFEENSTGYWMEGVMIYEEYADGKYDFTRMNMNGTWVDVTGRIDVERPSDWPPTFAGPETYYQHQKTLSSDFPSDLDMHGITSMTGTPNGFNQLWAPNESRLLALFDDREVPNRYYDPEKIEQLTGDIIFHASLSSYINDTVPRDTHAFAENTIQFQWEQTSDGYVYDNVSMADKVFVVDQYGEVIIQPRS
ncbi:MAG: hypothetical protein NWF04_02470 [Candidatus Bathyarchaeota archaeon]|nr:hypothetical protein [Candidatus Bathyarchaeota archaeon]